MWYIENGKPEGGVVTLTELSFLEKQAVKLKVALGQYLRKQLEQRHQADKIPRCLYCGVCIPAYKEDSIYSEFCGYCKTKIKEN